MSWKYTLDLLESYTFECIHVHQNHNHKGIPQDQCDNLIECEILPNSIKEQAIQYYIEGFTIRQIQSMLSANDDFKISIEKLYNVVEYYAKTHSENFTFDRIISSECHHTNAIIEFDRALMRFFITDLSRIEMWQKLQDVILIDSTYKVHESFRSAVFILTVDPYGSNYVLAMALTKKETENNYSWIFMNFLKHFQSPQVIFVDRNQAQYNALSDKFRNSKIIFCLWHIQRNLITYLTPLHISWSEFKKYWYTLYHSQDAKTFNINWSSNW
ncbi:unnamed protein product [Blepharisma stoltei]|uniref:MULE transposase domain-containing protein n=1 Tax=Blepharisma stoltei TaxID=1481888 RepID=A0AAU9JQK1_9CILI|nr:unnamed protein product [Blepharisma stoltei]